MFASNLIVAGANACVAFAMASTLRGGSDDEEDAAAPVSLVGGELGDSPPIRGAIPPGSGATAPPPGSRSLIVTCTVSDAVLPG